MRGRTLRLAALFCALAAASPAAAAPAADSTSARAAPDSASASAPSPNAASAPVPPSLASAPAVGVTNDPSCSVFPIVPTQGVAVMRLPRSFIRAGSDSVWTRG